MEAGFKDGARFSEQSKEKIVKYCRLVCLQSNTERARCITDCPDAKQARKQVGYLRRFDQDWATTKYLKRSFANRRGYLHRLEVDEAGPSGTHHNEDGNTGGDNGSNNSSDSDDPDDDLLHEDDEDEFENSDDDNGE